MGISGFASVNKNTQKTANIFKAYSHQAAGRLNLLELQVLKIRTSKSYYEIRTKCLTKMIKQCNRCHKIGHAESECRDKEYLCGFCAETHKSEDCPNSKEPSRYHCVNCAYNNVHDSYDRKNCHELKQAEEV